MILESHLLKAIKENGISKVAIVDDAFDPPAIDEDNAGKLLDYFDSKLFGEIAKELEVAADDIAKAIAAIKEGEYDTEEVSDLLRALYDRFVDTLEDKYDPGSIFSHQKDNIRNLHPILKLLAKCDPKIAIVRIGSDPDSVSGFEDDTHLVFIDFYLKTGVSERDSAAKRKSAKELAIETVTSIIQKQGDNAASVILMSSADVQADAEEFRKKITGEDKSLVFASRFAFVQKTQFRLDQDIVSIPHEAGDDLLDVLQSYEFGRGTHIALEAWFASAKDAAVKLHAQIAQMGLKDFAYLHRFRLAQEGERILPYLEWFFGQCLLDELGRSIDGRLGSEARIKALEGDAQKRIEGTFDGPTKTVASLYHQARIENPRDDKHSTFRLGDLFVSGTGANRTINAVLNPDCDLVVRNKRRNSKRAVTVAGTLRKFDAPEASASEFILLDDRHYNIAWQKKNIQTFEFADLQKAPFEFVGTLRPLYAQELQRNILMDLSRVGVSVAPAMGMSARATLHVWLATDQPKDIALGKPSVADCYVIPHRGGNDRSVVLFKRSFAAHLIETLSTLPSEGLAEGADQRLKAVKQADAVSRLSKMHQDGVAFEEFIEPSLGIYLTSKTTPRETEKPWCFVRVEMLPSD
ncbi:hypothetical protein ACVW0J_009499 [Bradyrhizobium sp. i1.7.7]